MLKVVALLSRLPGVTPERFVEHYESVHAPLILRSFPQIVRYCRNFVELSDSTRTSGVADPGFDVITEMWFEDRSSYHDMLRSYANPEIGGPVSADADLFLDMSKTIQFVVDVHESGSD